MKKLIKALTIFSKYTDKVADVDIGFDSSVVVGVCPDNVSAGDLKKLKKLGFEPMDGYDGFKNY
jgi:hypothetical protein